MPVPCVACPPRGGAREDDPCNTYSIPFGIAPGGGPSRVVESRPNLLHFRAVHTPSSCGISGMPSACMSLTAASSSAGSSWGVKGLRSADCASVPNCPLMLRRNYQACCLVHSSSRSSAARSTPAPLRRYVGGLGSAPDPVPCSGTRASAPWAGSRLPWPLPRSGVGGWGGKLWVLPWFPPLSETRGVRPAGPRTRDAS